MTVDEAMTQLYHAYGGDSDVGETRGELEVYVLTPEGTYVATQISYNADSNVVIIEVIDP